MREGNHQYQENEKILVLEVEQALPIEFSFLLPKYVDKVIGYECFFDAPSKIGSDKTGIEQLELSLSIDNFKDHSIHDIIQKNETTDYHGDVQFSLESRRRVTGFLHNPDSRGSELVKVKLFLIVQ